MTALGITAAGSLAGFSADVGSNVGQPDSVAVADVYAGGSMLAVFFLLAIGFWVDRQFDRRTALAPVSNA
jgi:hypothetical protein